MQESTAGFGAAWTAAFPTVRRLVEAGAIEAAEAILDRRSDVVLAIEAPRQHAAAQAMHDAGRALVALHRGDVEAARVFAISAMTLRRALGFVVEADGWMLELAAIAMLAGAVDEVACLHERIGHRIDPRRRATLAAFLGSRDDEPAGEHATVTELAARRGLRSLRPTQAQLPAVAL